MSDVIFPAWLVWFLLGIVFAVLELMVPGFIVIFFGIGCWVVAGFLLVLDLTIAQQIAVFSVSTIASILLLRKFLAKQLRGASYGGAGEDYDDFPKGVRVKVVRSISPNAPGRIQYRGTLWDAASDEEIQEGESVEIVRYADNSRLAFFVKKA